MRGVVRKARGASGVVEVCDPAQEGLVVARALWFGDPWTGDWEWQIRPEDPALRRRLDECYEANVDRYAGINFGSFSRRRSLAWISFEGLLGALRLALPGYGLARGSVEWPPECCVDRGDVAFDLYDADAADRAESEVQLAREQRLAGWAAAGEEPPEDAVEEPLIPEGVEATDV